MTLIDTSGNYGEGRSEELIRRVLAGQRDRAFVVSKVEANDVTGDAMARACEASLSRLGIDHLDLYLLHWPTPNAEFSEVVAGFESLRAAGKIRAWGVSNFTVTQMEDLFQIPQGDRCATNQVLYNLANRGARLAKVAHCDIGNARSIYRSSRNLRCCARALGDLSDACGHLLGSCSHSL